MADLVKVEIRKVRARLDRKAGIKYSYLADRALGVKKNGAVFFTRWLQRLHERDSPELKKVALLLGYKEEDCPAAILETADGVDVSQRLDGLARTSEWRRTGLVLPRHMELAPQTAEPVLRMAERLLELEKRDDFHRLEETVDSVFERYTTPEAGKHLHLLEELAVDELRTVDKRRSIFPHRLSTDDLTALAQRHKIRVRSWDLRDGGLLSFLAPGSRGSATLFVCNSRPAPTVRFEIAKQIGYVVLQKAVGPLQPLLDALGVSTDSLHSERHEKSLATEQLASGFAASLLLPHKEFLNSIKETALDLPLLARTYRTSIETVARRVFALSRFDKSLPPMHYLKVDLGGNILQKLQPPDYKILGDRRLGVCSKWASVRAFLRPAEATRQTSVFPDGRRYFCVAFVEGTESPEISTQKPLYSLTLGCDERDRAVFGYSKGFAEKAVRVGPVCAVCPLPDCEVRAVVNRDLVDHDPGPFRFARKVRQQSPLGKSDIAFMRNVVEKAGLRND